MSRLATPVVWLLQPARHTRGEMRGATRGTLVALIAGMSNEPSTFDETSREAPTIVQAAPLGLEHRAFWHFARGLGQLGERIGWDADEVAARVAQILKATP